MWWGFLLPFGSFYLLPNICYQYGLFKSLSTPFWEFLFPPYNREANNVMKAFYSLLGVSSKYLARLLKLRKELTFYSLLGVSRAGRCMVAASTAKPWDFLLPFGSFSNPYVGSDVQMALNCSKLSTPFWEFHECVVKTPLSRRDIAQLSTPFWEFHAMGELKPKSLSSFSFLLPFGSFLVEKEEEGKKIKRESPFYSLLGVSYWFWYKS